MTRIATKVKESYATKRGHRIASDANPPPPSFELIRITFRVRINDYN